MFFVLHRGSRLLSREEKKAGYPTPNPFWFGFCFAWVVNPSVNWKSEQANNV